MMENRIEYNFILPQSFLYLPMIRSSIHMLEFKELKKSFFSGLMATPMQVTKNNESKQKVYPMMGRMTTLSC